MAPGITKRGTSRGSASHLRLSQKKHNSRICFDPNYPDIDKKAFKKCDWKSFYGDAKEAISPNATGSKGKYVKMPTIRKNAENAKMRRKISTMRKNALK